MKLRLTKAELAGSLGDLPTFIVFLIGTTALCGLNPAAILIFQGTFNIVNGLAYGIPIAVQPMKAIGIIAISNGLPKEVIVASGVIMGGVILILSLFGVFEKLMRLIPKCVVRGIQLGLGLLFIKTAFGLIGTTKSFWGFDSYFVAALSCIVIFLLFDSKAFPAALVVFIAGALLAFSKGIGEFKFGIGTLGLSIPDKGEFASALKMLVIPQLPLTIANSLIATAALVKDYFPDKRNVTIDKIGLSVGIMNLVACPFGAIPSCHGAGGFAAQYRFGARTGGSVIFLGIAKVLLGLFLGAWFLSFSKAFPKSILGAMMIFAGVELATHIKDMREYKDVFVMVFVAGLSLIFDVALGFASGIVIYYFFKINGTKNASIH